MCWSPSAPTFGLYLVSKVGAGKFVLSKKTSTPLGARKKLEINQKIEVYVSNSDREQ